MLQFLSSDERRIAFHQEGLFFLVQNPKKNVLAQSGRED